MEKDWEKVLPVTIDQTLSNHMFNDVHTAEEGCCCKAEYLSNTQW